MDPEAGHLGDSMLAATADTMVSATIENKRNLTLVCVCVYACVCVCMHAAKGRESKHREKKLKHVKIEM